MGNLGDDTHIAGAGAGRYTGEISPDWNIWGPMGGYLASFALRAAGAESGRDRPASINGHFLGGATAGPVDITCVVQRATRVATSVHVTMHQGDRIVFAAMVWGVDAQIDGLAHQIEPPPITPFAELRSNDDLRAPGTPVFPFWHNVDFRPTQWIEDWDNRTETEPVFDGWFEFRPQATFDDPWLDACRLLIVVDVGSWPAAHRAYLGEVDYVAPTIEVTARFLGDVRAEPHVFAAASVPVAANGLMAHEATVWTSEGALVATGGSTLMCRPTQRVEARIDKK